jgi:hypothetical protein
VEEVRVLGVDLGSQQVHSIAFDRFGNLWFTQSTFPVTSSVRNSIGYIPPLELESGYYQSQSSPVMEAALM